MTEHPEGWNGDERRSTLPSEDRAVLAGLLADEFKHQNQTLRRALLWSTIAIFFIVSALSVWARTTRDSTDRISTDVTTLTQIAKDNKRTLNILEGRDPLVNETQKQQMRSMIAQIADAIDCKQRSAFQDLLNSLVRRGVLAQDDASIVKSC